MSRKIDVNDPGSWNDDDIAYLRDRQDMVPVTHRAKLNPDDQMVIPPALVAESLESDRLRRFLVANFPEEMTKGDDTPVGVAIRILSSEFETVDPEENDVIEATGNDYDEWTVAKLKDELNTRVANGRDIRPASDRKNDLITALRTDDATA